MSDDTLSKGHAADRTIDRIEVARAELEIAQQARRRAREDLREAAARARAHRARPTTGP